MAHRSGDRLQMARAVIHSCQDEAILDGLEFTQHRARLIEAKYAKKRWRDGLNAMLSGHDALGLTAPFRLRKPERRGERRRQCFLCVEEHVAVRRALATHEDDESLDAEAARARDATRNVQDAKKFRIELLLREAAAPLGYERALSVRDRKSTLIVDTQASLPGNDDGALLEKCST